MKAGQTLIGLLVLLGMVLSFAPRPASAQSKWYVCSVLLAGKDSGEKVSFVLNDKRAAFTKTAFAAPEGSEDRMLAIAMVSKVNNIPVSVYVDISVKPRVIEKMLLGP
jgi:hypothetical protein